MQKTVKKKVEQYPAAARLYFKKIRNLVLANVSEHKLVGFEETLKWGEPAYLTKNGSTVRVDWKASTPDYIWVFFNCNSILVETIREVYGEIFAYEKNRAIGIALNADIPTAELQHCLLMALNYHKLKRLSLLGA